MTVQKGQRAAAFVWLSLLLLLGFAPKAAAEEEEYAFLCETQEEAQQTAKLLGAELQDFSYGVATITAEQTDADALNEEAERLDAPCGEIAEDEEITIQWDAAEETLNWQHEAVKTQQAWELTGKTGEGIIIAVIDSGVDTTHPDLQGQILEAETQIPASAYEGGTLGGAADAEDYVGHGTHVCGIIAALSGNGIGIDGIAPGAKIISIKALDDNGKGGGTGKVSWTAAAIAQAVEQGAQIINMSIGIASPNAVLKAAIDKAADAGVLLVSAAGNTNSAINKAVYYPAAYDNVVAVTGVVQDGQSGYKLGSFSRYGAQSELCAPADLYSTIPGGYGTKQGTSMASPVVAAVAALAWSAVPQATAAQVRQSLQEAAADLGDAGWDALYGYGLVDAQETAVILAAKAGGRQSGDVDGDGFINVRDAAMVRRHVANLNPLTDADALAAADVNGDGKLNVEDANLIRRYVAKLIDSF